MTPDLFKQVASARIIDLAQEWRIGMPHWPTHPPFLYSLSKGHGDIVGENGVSSAAEVITFGGHVGTHIDALCHFSKHGKLFGGIDAEPVQTFEHGITERGIDTVGPIVRRSVFLDAAPGADILQPSQPVTAADLDAAESRAGVEVGRGDVVLIRTGWGQLWARPRLFAMRPGPGVDLSAACWLSGRGVFAGGSDTLAFEVQPTAAFPVHVHLLVENGIHIIEALNLEALRAAGIHEFLFVASPLKIIGGTASPIRPFALV